MTLRSQFALSTAVCLTVGTLCVQPARATFLRYKWQAGQLLSYAVQLDGTFDTQTAADVPVIWAGLPVQIGLHSQATSQLQTLAVDPAGAATLSLRMTDLALNATGLGQAAEFDVHGGKTQLLLNGRPLTRGDAAADDRLAASILAPPVAWSVNADGKLIGLKKLPDAAADAPAADGTNPAGTNPLGTNPPPADPNAGLALAKIAKSIVTPNALIQSLPALWPERDLQPGDSWDVVIPWAAPEVQAAAAATPLGQFHLTFVGLETVDGVSLAHVKVDGKVGLDAAKLAQVNAAAKKSSKPGAAPADPGGPVGAELSAATETVQGDLWFDADQGRVVKAQFQLNGRTSGHSVTANGQHGDESWADFTGTLQLALQPPAA